MFEFFRRQEQLNQLAIWLSAFGLDLLNILIDIKIFNKK